MSTYQPLNLAGLCWLEGRRAASFAASRPGYGVQNVETGAVLSTNGVQPSAWRTRATAAEIAPYAEGMPGFWVRVFGSPVEAQASLIPELDAGSAAAFRNSSETM